MKKRLSLCALLALLTIAFVLTFGPGVNVVHRRDKENGVSPLISPSRFRSIARNYVPSRQSLPGQPALVALPSAPDLAENRSPLADNLNLPVQDASTDLSIVSRLLGEYRRVYGAFPTGENNAQIVNALSGNNQKKLAFLPRNSPAVSALGELVDRWGSPYFFHIVSSQEIEIRSAGPDRELRTVDDIVGPAR